MAFRGLKGRSSTDGKESESWCLDGRVFSFSYDGRSLYVYDRAGEVLRQGFAGNPRSSTPSTMDNMTKPDARTRPRVHHEKMVKKRGLGGQIISASPAPNTAPAANRRAIRLGNQIDGLGFSDAERQGNKTRRLNGYQPCRRSVRRSLLVDEAVVCWLSRVQGIG